MIPWIGACFGALCFGILIHTFNLVAKSSQAVKIAQKSFEIIGNAALNDDIKEKALQNNAGQLLRLFVILALRGATAILVPLGILWLADQFGWLSLQSVLSVTLSTGFLIASSIAVILIWFISIKKTNYARVDRVLHHIAFKTTTAQVALADFEDHLYAAQLSTCSSQRPVFITALPRAGTTLLLECCAGLAEFATHTYRQMPFVLIPCLWHRFSANFHQTGQLQERAHGDGMFINFDSPEAFEEVLWKKFWRKHYQHDRIIPWLDENHDEFALFFHRHMRKIILLQSGGKGRYISKNNLNIARIQLLQKFFPDAMIIIAFRHPLQHAASLLAQHCNFLHIHQRDAFARRYMAAIGHYDFGANLRPIDFGGWLNDDHLQNTQSLTFWLTYWVATYQYLLNYADNENLFFLSYDMFCQKPGPLLERLSEIIGITDMDTLTATHIKIHASRPRVVDPTFVDSALTAKADRLYAHLEKVAL